MMEHLAHCDSAAQMPVSLNTYIRIDKYKVPPVTYYAVLQTKLERIHFDKFAVMRISKHIISAPRLWKCQ
jgi:hypothetical protein